jgi:hypothetical protein
MWWLSPLVHAKFFGKSAIMRGITFDNASGPGARVLRWKIVKMIVVLGWVGGGVYVDVAGKSSSAGNLPKYAKPPTPISAFIPDLF